MGYTPKAPGPQRPSLYDVAPGTRYQYWGEQEGYRYDPRTDTYTFDPEGQRKLYEDKGLVESQPKPQSTMDVIGPVAGITAATEAARYIGKEAVPAATDAIGGLLGIGKEAAARQALNTTMTSGQPSAAALEMISTQAPAGAAEAGLVGLGEQAATTGASAAAPATPTAIGASRVGPGVLAQVAPYAGLVGMGLGAKGVYDATQMGDKKEAGVMGAIGGAGFGAGLAMAAPLLGLGPIGWAAIGLMALGGGLAGFGMAHKSTKEVQKERAQKLIGKGVVGYKEFYDATKASNEDYLEKFKPQIGNSYGFRKDLDENFVGIDPASGRWINNKFAKSGKVSDLTGKDVWGSQGVFDTFGNDWFGKYNEQQREEISNRMLQEGIFKTDRGDVIVSDKDKARALAIGNEVLAAQAAQPQQEGA